MVTIAELLASSLELAEVQDGSDLMMVKSSQIPLNHLQELMDKNFIKQTAKDWYVVLDKRALPFLKSEKKSIGCVAKVA